jgi:glycosyltransferase involved in cell wall biosynthesis
MGKTHRHHILIIVQNLPVPFDRRVWQEAITLSAAGYEVSVICPKMGSWTQGREEREGVHIHRYRLPVIGRHGIVSFFAEFAYCWLRTLLSAIWIMLRRPFHVIHACNPPDTYFLMALLFRPFGVKFVFDHHDLSPEMFLAKGFSQRHVLYRALLWLEKATLRSAHAVIAVNESHRDIAIKRGGVRPGHISIVRSGPPRQWTTPLIPIPGLREGHRYLVAYLGEMCVQDGVDLLLRAIQTYRGRFGNDTLFVLVGGGPEHDSLRRLAGTLGLDDVVTFTGRVPDATLREYLYTADLCVDPDPLTEWSNMSTMNKIIEYMACGRPVVAFDLLEHRRTADQAALYVAPNDVDAFADAIRNLLLDPDTLAQMGNFAQQRFVDVLCWENAAQYLRGLYDHLLSCNQGQSA